MIFLDATCSDNKVTCEGKEIEGVTILSKGKASSSGYLFIHEDKKIYLAVTIADLESTLEKVIDGLTAAKSGLNSTASSTCVNGAPLSGSGSISSAASQVDSAVSALQNLKGNLK